MHGDGGMSWDVLMGAIGGRMGVFDVPCPICSPRRKPANRRKPVLRVWRNERPDFATFCCQHCGSGGYAHDGSPSAQRVDRQQIGRLMRAADKVHIDHINDRRRTARFLWDSSLPIAGTLAESYLRGRGITCPLPATLRFLPARGEHAPAMISVFGIPAEPEPGKLDVTGMAIGAVHITRLKADGSGKANIEGQPDKIFIGGAPGLPIALAPCNDLSGLAIAEGIEDALSLHQSTGLGAWAAGSANRLPSLARAVPRYVSSVSIAIDDNDVGRESSYELARQLRKVRNARYDVRLLESWLLQEAAA